MVCAERCCGFSQPWEPLRFPVGLLAFGLEPGAGRLCSSLRSLRYPTRSIPKGAVTITCAGLMGAPIGPEAARPSSPRPC